LNFEYLSTLAHTLKFFMISRILAYH